MAALFGDPHSPADRQRAAVGGNRCARWLSVGAALNVEYSDALLSNALPNLAAGLPDARLKLTGDGWDFGWSAGLQLRPTERLSFGIGYKSAITHRSTDASRSAACSGRSPRAMPTPTSPPVSRRPGSCRSAPAPNVTERVTLNVQAVRYGWSKFDAIRLGAPLGNAVPENYKDTWSFALGADAEATSRLTVRAGIQLDPTPTRNTARDPRVPDADRVDYNVGASFRIGEHLTLDGAAALTDFRNSAISRDEHFYAGTPAQTNVLTDGSAVRQRAVVISFGGRIAL